MKFFIPVILFMAAVFPACDDSYDVASGAEDILVVDSHAGFSLDECRIKTIHVDTDILTAEVEYGGGCGNVEFKLLASSVFMESNPVQSAVTVSFKDEDPCKALVTRQLRFNLRPLAEAYKAAYQVDSGTILLRISNYHPQITYSF